MTPGPPSIRLFLWAWVIFTVVIYAVALSVWVPTGVYKEMDFRAMYTAGLLARTDPTHLYDLSRQGEIQQTRVKNDDLTLAFPHLAYEALLFAPLTLFSYRTAYLLMILPNSVLVLLSFLAARQEFSEVIPLWQPRPGFIFFTFMPTMIALAQGQDSLLLLLVVCLTWRLLDRSEVFGAGMVLAAMLFKPHLALLLAFFLVVRYGWRFAAGFMAGSAAVAAACLPFWLHGGFRTWISVLSEQSLVSPRTAAQANSVAIYAWVEPNLRGALLLLLGHVLSSHVLFGVTCLASLAMLAWGLVMARRLSARNAFAFSVFTTALVSYNLESHDLAILLLPVVLMEPGGSKALAWCRDLVLGLPIALLIFAPSNPPGGHFTLMAIPLLATVIALSRTGAAQRSLEAVPA